MNRQALGKGLRALIPEGPASMSAGREGVRPIPVEGIRPNPFQPRRHFSEEGLRELAESIRVHGVLEPLVVRPSAQGAGGFELVVGERRWRAARLAGLDSVPAMVREVGDREMVQMALVENLQREDLNPIEQAEAYRRLIDEFGMTQEEVAQMVGRKRPTIANTLRLLELETPIQSAVLEGRLSEGHAKALMSAPAGSVRVELAGKAEREGWSVRQVEQAVRRLLEAAAADAQAATGTSEVGQSGDPWRELEAGLGRVLGTRVVIRQGRRKGRIEIEFYSNEELMRLLELLGGIEVEPGKAG